MTRYTEIRVRVPTAYMEWCQDMDVPPDHVLTHYADDLGGIGNGSDERDMAYDHFQRSGEYTWLRSDGEGTPRDLEPHERFHEACILQYGVDEGWTPCKACGHQEFLHYDGSDCHGCGPDSDYCQQFVQPDPYPVRPATCKACGHEGQVAFPPDRQQPGYWCHGDCTWCNRDNTLRAEWAPRVEEAR